MDFMNIYIILLHIMNIYNSIYNSIMDIQNARSCMDIHYSIMDIQNGMLEK